MKKVAFISGATGNLGTAVVNQFFQSNYVVWGTTHQESGSTLPENLYLKPLNLLDVASTEAFMEELISSNGRLDAAVLTVGGYSSGGLTNSSIEDIHHQWRLNFETAYNAVKPIFKIMRKQGYGRIFFIGSQAGKDVSNGTNAIGYALAKSLLFRLSEIINEESKEINVASVVVVPSIIDTPQNRRDMPNADFSKWTTPETIAEKIFQLAEDSSKPSEENKILMV